MTTVLILLSILWTLVLVKPLLWQSRADDEPPTTLLEPPGSEPRIRNNRLRNVLTFFGLLEDRRDETPWWLRGPGGFGGFGGFGGGGCHGGGGC